MLHIWDGFVLGRRVGAVRWVVRRGVNAAGSSSASPWGWVGAAPRGFWKQQQGGRLGLEGPSGVQLQAATPGLSPPVPGRVDVSLARPTGATRAVAAESAEPVQGRVGVNGTILSIPLMPGTV